MNNPAIIAWLIELFKRYGQKSPKFFVVLKWVGVAASLVTGVPQLLEWLAVPLPVEWQPVVQQVIFYCGLVTALVSAATVENGTTVVKAAYGDNKTVVVNESLPFTAQTEVKKAESDPTTNVITSPNPPAPKA